MKENILLQRYDKTEKGDYIISVKVDSFQTLFNEFDFHSSYWKRDLREEFVAYLIECADEIGLKNKFVIQVVLPVEEKKKRDNIEQKFSEALKHYFYYLVHLSEKNIKKIVRKIIFNFFISIALLSVVFFTSKMEGDKESMLYMIFNEGLYIAIWVLMWPVFSDFLFDLKEEFDNIAIYRRITKTKVVHVYF